MTFQRYHPPELSTLEKQEEYWRHHFWYDLNQICQICYTHTRVKSDEIVGWSLCERCYVNGWRGPLGRVIHDNRSALIYATATSRLIIYLHPK